MKFYKLSISNDLEEVGAYPHCESVKKLGDIQQDFLPFKGEIKIDFNLPEPTLEKRAIQNALIDVVAIPSRFLVIDDDFLAFLIPYIKGNYQNWKLQTWKGKTLIEKYNLFILNDTKQNNYIDFSKSEFYTGTYRDFTYKGEKVAVKSYKDYLSKREELRQNKLWLRESKIVFDLRNTTEDIFRIVNAPFAGYYVSQKLKIEIQKNDFTGLSFVEISEQNSMISVID